MLSEAFGFDVEIKIVSNVFEEKCIYSITPGLSSVDTPKINITPTNMVYYTSMCDVLRQHV